ncbi:thioredoxin-like protein [Xylariales sp. PMI_506]|nr:thioredoxin-like protein [Xylariales sp. PMI_506]
MTTRSTPPPLVVEFHYDIVCPFAYIASTRIEAIAAHAGPAVTVAWRPVLLGGIYRATAAPQGAQGSATDAFNPTKRAAFGRQFQRTLRRLRVPLNQPREHPRKTVDAVRLLHRLPDGGPRARVSHALFRAYWVDHTDVADREALLRVVRDALGYLESDAKKEELMRRAADFDDPASKQALEAATSDAVAKGAPGVPAFWIPEEKWTDSLGRSQQGRLYWGQDRLHFVHASLLDLSGRLAGASAPRVLELLPRCRPLAPISSPVKLEFWYDFSSPWAYLGWTGLDRLRRTFGSKLEIEMKPFLLGALFKKIGAPMLPMMATSKPKMEYGQNDLRDWARFWNKVNEQEGISTGPLPFRWPDQFPIRSPTMLRCAIIDPTCIPVLYRASWALNKNVSDEAVLKEVLTEGGFDAEKLIAQTKQASVKETLISNTQAAEDAGFCGVPTYRVFHQRPDNTWKQNGGFIWGQDETATVEDLILGWDENSDEPATAIGEDTSKRTTQAKI